MSKTWPGRAGSHWEHKQPNHRWSENNTISFFSPILSSNHSCRNEWAALYCFSVPPLKTKQNNFLVLFRTREKHLLSSSKLKEYHHHSHSSKSLTTNKNGTILPDKDFASGKWQVWKHKQPKLKRSETLIWSKHVCFKLMFRPSELEKNLYISNTGGYYLHNCIVILPFLQGVQGISSEEHFILTIL